MSRKPKFKDDCIHMQITGKLRKVRCCGKLAVRFYYDSGSYCATCKDYEQLVCEDCGKIGGDVENLSVHTKELIKYQKLVLNYIDREKKFKEIYDKANRLLAVIGAEGDINPQSTVCEDLMNALFEFDGGTWETEKMFPDYK